MKSFLALLGLAVVLSGCGSSTGDRAASGAVTGAVTDEETIDLGEPLWADDNYAGRAAGGAADSDQVTRLQHGLARLGYDPGPADGKYGPRTKRAIERFQADHGLPTDGLVTGQLAAHVRQQVAQKN